MHFTIDGKPFIVGVAGWPLLLDGQAVDAKIDYRAGRIWLSDQLPKHERKHKLIHELRHGWIGAHGQAADAEADADQFADAMIAIMDAYQAQGGDSALEGMAPTTKESTGPRAAAMLALREAECGYCHATTAVGSIANGKPEWSPSLNSHVCDRGILCEICDSVTTWREVSTGEGEPLGSIVPFPPPRVLIGPAAAAWIAEHQATARVRVNA